jgi:hypothetical protein
MATDGYKRVRADAPIDALDDIDDWLYMSEVTYIMILRHLHHRRRRRFQPR